MGYINTYNLYTRGNALSYMDTLCLIMAMGFWVNNVSTFSTSFIIAVWILRSEKGCCYFSWNVCIEQPKLFLSHKLQLNSDLDLYLLQGLEAEIIVYKLEKEQTCTL